VSASFAGLRLTNRLNRPMRWKLWRRRLSVSAPRMIVRSHLPWPLRWAVAALAFGFSGALALWAFETGKDIAGLDRDAKEELRLRVEVAQLRDEREKRAAIANTADSLLKAERTAQERLAQQLRQTEAENLALQERPGILRALAARWRANRRCSIRGLQAEAVTPGQLRYQLLLMQTGKSPARVQRALRDGAFRHAGGRSRGRWCRRGAAALAGQAVPPRRGPDRPSAAGRDKNGEARSPTRGRSSCVAHAETSACGASHGQPGGFRCVREEEAAADPHPDRRRHGDHRRTRFATTACASMAKSSATWSPTARATASS
jgi:hypothetical protein